MENLSIQLLNVQPNINVAFSSTKTTFSGTALLRRRQFATLLKCLTLFFLHTQTPQSDAQPNAQPANTYSFNTRPPQKIQLHTDSPLQYVALDAWTTENGLPHNAVLDMVQTKDGYLWFGSFNGVVRFDGKNFDLLRRSNTSEFGSNTITTLWEDTRQNLWFGVQEGGVVVLRSNGTMLRLDSTYGFRDKMIRGWTENRVKSSPEYGTVYFAANKGIYAVTMDSARNRYRISFDSTYNQVNAEAVSDVLCDKNGGFWLATRKGLVYYPSRSNSSAVRVFDTSSGLPNVSVECVHQDRSGTVWIGTRKGVCRFAGGQILQDAELRETTPVHDFVEDKSGNLWIGTDKGLILWTKSNTKPRRYNFSAEEGLTDDSIRSLTEDSEGNIWVGTYYGGLNRLKRGIFSTITAQDGLINPVAYAALEARDGAMWVATFGGVQRITASGTTRYTTQNGLQSALGRALAEDSAGNIWVGTYGALHKISPQGNSSQGNSSQGRITAYTTRDGLVDDQIRSLCAARDGTLWVGTVQGISLLRNGVFTPFDKEYGALPSNSVLGITQDRSGKIWISMSGGGVMTIDPKSGVKSFLQADQGLPSNDAFRITESPKGDEIWIPCNGGLVMVKNGKSTMFTMKDGLPDENVFHVLEDASGRLWITCNIGIFSVSKANVLECAENRKRLVCRLYTRADGLKTNSCTVPSFACATRSGDFWIPMLKGVAIICPARISPNTVPPPVYCLSVHADTVNGIAVNAVITTKNRTITLPAGAERMEIRFAAVCLTAQEQVEYRFMLEGIDHNWVRSETRRSAFYTNLPPGSYTFRVKACNNDGLWNETGDSITIIQEAFFYQTWWFYALCGLAFLGLGVVILRFRTWRLKARAGILEKMVQMRTRQIEEHAEEIEQQNAEIKRQLEILDHQAREIELTNTTLNEKNLHLSEANAEIQRQQHILESQASDIELANSELQERNAQLQALNQEKNEFLGIATHDLKNPIASIRMSISLVQKYYDRMSKDEVLERLGAVETSAERMTNIISNLLDINAIESGNFNVHLQTVEIAVITRKITDEYKERATAKNLALYLDIAEEPMNAYADGNVMMEVLDNLISNAVKYSPSGKNIFIRLKSSADKVLVEVRDEGPGLSEDDKSKLFGKFMRLSARPTAGEHSTGLGLSIVKKMVEAMNGKVWCESELGKGARFCVELPRGLCAEA